MTHHYSHLFAAAAILAATTQINAGLISGEINFDGSATLDKNLATSSSIISFQGVTIGYDTQTGAYNTGIDGAPATFTPFSFESNGNPSLSPNPVTVWSFQNGGVDYSFKLTSITAYTVTGTTFPSFLNIEGSGVASITGYQNTPGDFTLTVTGLKTHVTFAASTGVRNSGNPPVPEPSSWALISGFGLVSFGLFRRIQK